MDVAHDTYGYIRLLLTRFLSLSQQKYRACDSMENGNKVTFHSLVALCYWSSISNTPGRFSKAHLPPQVHLKKQLMFNEAAKVRVNQLRDICMYVKKKLSHKY